MVLEIGSVAPFEDEDGECIGAVDDEDEVRPIGCGAVANRVEYSLREASRAVEGEHVTASCDTGFSRIGNLYKEK